MAGRRDGACRDPAAAPPLQQGAASPPGAAGAAPPHPNVLQTSMCNALFERLNLGPSFGKRGLGCIKYMCWLLCSLGITIGHSYAIVTVANKKTGNDFPTEGPRGHKEPREMDEVTEIWTALPSGSLEIRTIGQAHLKSIQLNVDSSYVPTGKKSWPWLGLAKALFKRIA